ncbi:unnamed protein product [Mytilus edulis]|uniref:Uncharacterized protein n=1 Tax=Mytilus edulis TaxID=6550 RepID=A0A8S3T9J5_MYTED|nr:unnamed protein product [Mytilus edulis]
MGEGLTGAKSELPKKKVGCKKLRVQPKPRKGRSRVAVSSQETIDDYFKLLESTINKLNLQDKPSQVWNADEARFGKETDQTKQKIISPTEIRHHVDPHIIAVTAEVHADIKTTEESESLEQIKLCRPRVRKANKKFRKIESAEDDEDDEMYTCGVCVIRGKKNNR